MKGNYITSILLLFFGLVNYHNLIGQISIIANDDTRFFTNQNITPPAQSILENDLLNGMPIVGWQPVVLNFPETFPADISINEAGFVIVGSQTPSGTYIIPYEVCDADGLGICDSAAVTITVDYCRTATPLVDSLTQPTCELPFGSISLSGLPEIGQWAISYVNINGPAISITGTGTTFTVSNLAPGNYTLNVTEEDILLGNCFESFNLNFSIDNIFSGLDVSMSGAYQDLNNDGFTNVGDVINYSFIVSNNTCQDVTNVSLLHQSLNIEGGPILVLGPTTVDSTTFTATYVITQNDINNGFIINSIAVQGTQNGTQIFNDAILTIGLNISDGIKLMAFFDSNANGIRENSEPFFPYGQFQYITNGGPINNIASSNGVFFLYESNPSNSYNVSYIIDSAYVSYYTVSPSAYSNITVAAGSGITTYNFPITVLPHSDVSIQIYGYGAPPRPGFIYQNYIGYTNNSNLTITSGAITFVKDPLLTITNISTAGAVTNADGFTYDFVNLQPNETRNIIVSMQVPTIPTVSLGQLVTNTCSISIPADDVNINNNSSSLTQTIVGSYDPNDKTESHGGKIVHATFTNDDYLTYTIRFENTGTASAINVRVDDLLDNQLDENSIRTIAASHPYVLRRVNNALSWQFEGIDLPPSIENDPITGHGYIVFQVKPKPDFALGDVIPNTAEIYFDFNPPIVTEPCLTEFVEFLGVNAFDADAFAYYPNPTSGEVTFSMKNTKIEKIEVMDVLGKTLLTKTNNYSSATIDLFSLSKGMYLVKVTANGLEKTVKIVKE